MPLVELLNDLSTFKYYAGKGSYSRTGDFAQKEIKHGRDQRGGGTSNESNFINELYSPNIPSTIPVFGQDNLIRGGATVFDKTEKDLLRFENFIQSPAGLFFIAKQELLARQEGKLPRKIKPTRIYSPLQTATQVGGNAFGLHVLGKGLGVVDDITAIVSGRTWPLSNAPSVDPTNRYLYLTQTKFNNVGVGEGEANTNRLSLLYDYKILTPGKKEKNKRDEGQSWLGGAISNIGNAAKNLLTQNSAKELFGIPMGKRKQHILFSFSGGPNAIVPGASWSRYHRVMDTQAWIFKVGTGGVFDAEQSFAVLSIDQISNANAFKGKPIISDKLIDFRQTILDEENVFDNSPISKTLSSTDYTKFNRQNVYKTGDPGKRGLDRTDNSWGASLTTGNQKPDYNISSDRINWKPLYKQADVDYDIANQDIIPFYITVLDNDDPTKNVHIHFRAFIEGV